MTHTIARPFHARLDAGRIAAETGAIAVNAVLLMLLLAPLTPPLPLPSEHKDPDVVIIEPLKRPPDPPIPVDVVRPPRPERPVQTPPRSEARQAPVQDPPPIAMDDGGLPAVDAAPSWTGSVDPPSIDPGPGSGPQAGAQLQYADAPPPPYPRQAIREGLTGTVLLEVLVDVDGRPLRVDVSRSSGHRSLDLAARRQVLSRWRFVPAQRDGRPVQAIGLVPVDFSLER